MSVLLDALKKAAAEKKAKQAGKIQVERDDQAGQDLGSNLNQRKIVQTKQESDTKANDLKAELAVEKSKSNSSNPKTSRPSSISNQVLPESEHSLSRLELDEKPSLMESKFKLADADIDTTTSYSSSSSRLMDVLGEVSNDSKIPKKTSKLAAESNASLVENTRESTSKPKLNQNLSAKQSELEALFKPGNQVSEKQRALQSKQVKKLFSPALTTTMKPIKTSITRKFYLFFLGLSLLAAVLIYYALFVYQDLDQQYERQVQQFTSTIERPVPLPQDKSLEKTDAEPAAQSIKSTDEPTVESVDEALPEESRDEETKKTNNANGVKQKPVSQSTTRPGSNVQIKRVEKVDENQLAYEAYLKSDFKTAEYHYRRGLAQNPNSKNSQIGLAALAAQHGDYEQAMSYYHRVLQQNSEDEDALQGIASIAAELGHQESMLNDLVDLARRYPESATLQFALGNQYAQRQDWFKAQQHYFDSVRLEQNNPDYRLNLAVSLDHLGQFNNALEHYKHSLALVENQPSAQFDATTVYQRINVLQSFLEQN